METDQLLVVLVLAVTFALFAWGRLRYDAVAILALLSLVVVMWSPATRPSLASVTRRS